MKSLRFCLYALAIAIWSIIGVRYFFDQMTPVRNEKPDVSLKKIEVENVHSGKKSQKSKPVNIKSPEKDSDEETKQEKKWHRVKATREGLVGKQTATGFRIKEDSVFVALPHRSALKREVEVKYGDTTVKCKVRDIGPHSIYDDYWNEDRRPLAEKGIRLPKKWGEAKNDAGIDLSDGLWDKFGIKRGVGIVEVQWRFVEKEKE